MVKEGIDMRQPKKKCRKKKYLAPKLERYKVDDLAKGWDLEVIGKAVSCPSNCIF